MADPLPRSRFQRWATPTLLGAAIGTGLGAIAGTAYALERLREELFKDVGHQGALAVFFLAPLMVTTALILGSGGGSVLGAVIGLVKAWLAPPRADGR